MNTDKPVIQENEQSALDDKTTFNDGPISSGNSTFCSFYCFLFCLYSETCIKVAEHSFRARFCWRNWARAQGLQRAIILFTQHPHYLCYFFSIIECSVLMALVFYYKDMLEKVTTQKTQQFSAFSLLPKEPS